MKKVICDHAWRCRRSECQHHDAHDRFDNDPILTCESDICAEMDETVRCVEAPDDAS